MLRSLLRRLLGAGGDASPVPDDEPVKVILGLGNPGAEYEHTRHNVGWWVLDHLADVWRVRGGGWRKDGEARAATGLVDGRKVRLVKPLTYMNLGGAVLRPYLRRPFWSPRTDLLVVVDEVALPAGRYRFRAQGSPGGHNGLKSVQGVLGQPEYPRLRIGVGPPNEAELRAIGDLAGYVLAEPGEAEARRIRALFPTLADAVALWLREGIVPVMNRYTGLAASEE